MAMPALSQGHKYQREAICASLLARHRLAREQHLPFLSCSVVGDDKWGIHANIKKRKEWVCRNTKTFALQQKDNVMHLVEQRRCAVLWIDFPRCIHPWQLLTTTETQSKKNDQQDWVKWCYSSITTARTLLTLQKTLCRSWIGKSFRTHLVNWSWDLRFSHFRSLWKKLQGTSIPDETVLLTWHDDFFNSKPRDFYKREIENYTSACRLL